jgi:hypothetical protein
MTGYLEFTGLTLSNCRIDEYHLPGREITDVMLYHMFASGLFELVRVKRAYESTYQEYNRAQMQNYVVEKDRLEIRKLQAELAEAKKSW